MLIAKTPGIQAVMSAFDAPDAILESCKDEIEYPSGERESVKRETTFSFHLYKWDGGHLIQGPGINVEGHFLNGALIDLKLTFEPFKSWHPLDRSMSGLGYTPHSFGEAFARFSFPLREPLTAIGCYLAHMQHIPGLASGMARLGLADCETLLQAGVLEHLSAHERSELPYWLESSVLFLAEG